MGKNNKKGPKANVFKVAGAKSLKKTKAKAVNLGLKNVDLDETTSLIRHSNYKRKPGSRRYIEYTKSQLDACINAIMSRTLTQREASIKYNIPCSTIKVKMSQKSASNRPGRPYTFSDTEERLFAQYGKALCDYGFPVVRMDIRMIIRDYLISHKKTISQFRSNLPGKDWLKSFLERYTFLSERLSFHPPQLRAQVTRVTIKDFIESVSEITEGLPPESIYSYDEISFCNASERNIIVCRRVEKYPEIMINPPKACFSVMFCGNAAGEALPPYVNCKADHLCSIWTTESTDGIRYNSTKNGWIDMTTFQDWFINHLLPVLKQKPGRKVLIGDHLSSPINGKVLIECKKNNISFIALPPNAVHVLHPLDVAYYEPLKSAWSQLIIALKSVQTETTTSKSYLPDLLKRALNFLKDSGSNLIAGFRETGIYPIDKEEPYKRLFKDIAKKVKRRELEELHKTIFDPNFEGTSEFGWEEMEQLGEPLQIKEKCDQTISIPQRRSFLEATLASSKDDYLIVVNEDGVLLTPLLGEPPDNPHNAVIGDHVIVSQGLCNNPGKILATTEEGAIVHCMKKAKNFWQWPMTMNAEFYTWENIVCKIANPVLIRTGYYSVPEMV